jgi:hypothetical protein
VRRFALAVLVALLTFSSSGLSSVLVPEPCTGVEETGSEDAACPPTCVTCGCCAQAAEPAILSIASSPDAPVVDVGADIPRVPAARASEILHVPRRHIA